MIKQYETVFIATPVLSEAQMKEAVAKYVGLIKENGGEVVYEEDWGLKQLAYPIQKKTTGFYYLIEFRADSQFVDVLETQYRRDERIIRFLTFAMDKHAVAYAPLKMRSALVPVVSFASNIVSWVLLIGMLLLNVFPGLLLFGIALFAMTTLFSFITLPVEVNASQRALVWLKSSGVTNSYNHGKAEDALRSAAYTYVVAALGSLATLLYYVMIFMGSDRD